MADEVLQSRVATGATAQTGSVRLTGAESRQRLQAGGGAVTLSTKLLTRRTDLVFGLMPAGGGAIKPSPERIMFALGEEGTREYESAMAEYVSKDLGGAAKQVCMRRHLSTVRHVVASAACACCVPG